MIAVVGGGPYGALNGFTYNSQAANQSNLYGARVAGFYNQTITKIDEDNVELIKGNGTCLRIPTAIWGPTITWRRPAPGIH